MNSKITLVADSSYNLAAAVTWKYKKRLLSGVNRKCFIPHFVQSVESVLIDIHMDTDE